MKNPEIVGDIILLDLHMTMASVISRDIPVS